MRAAAILGLGCSPKNLKPFQTNETIDWRIGIPAARDQGTSFCFLAAMAPSTGI
jgi:hypothetical protein